MSLEYIRHSDNKILTAQILSDEEMSGYPTSNLKDPHTSISCRLNNHSDDGIVRVHILFPGDTEFDSFALIGHNLSSSATIEVYGGDEYNPTGLLWGLDWIRDDILKVLSVAISHRYLTLAIEDPTNLSGYIQIGNVVVGTRTNTLIALQSIFDVTKRYVQQRQEASSGHIKVKHLTRKKSKSFRTAPLLLSEMQTLKSLSDKNEGTEHTLWMFDEDSYFGYGLLDAEFEREFDTGPRVQSQLSVKHSAPAILVPKKLPIFRAGESLPSDFTFSRTTVAHYKNKDLQLVEAAIDEWRNNHFIAAGVKTILQEPGYTNELLDSNDFASGSNWDGAVDFTITEEDSLVWPGQSGWRHENPGTLSGRSRRQDLGVLTGNVETLSVILSNVDSTISSIGIRDVTAASWVALAEYNWSTGVFAITSGTGVVGVEAYYDGAVRLTLSATGTVGNSRRLYIYPTGTNQNSDTAIIHHAQHEERNWSTSPIITGAGPVSRGEDRLSSPWTFGTRSITGYLDMIEVGSRYTPGSRFWVIGPEGVDTSPRLLSYLTTAYVTYWNPVSTSAFASRSFGNLNDFVEIRNVLTSEGSVIIGVSKNGGAEDVAGPGSALGIPDFGDTLAVGSSSGFGNPSILCYRKLAFQYGTQSREVMRSL